MDSSPPPAVTPPSLCSQARPRSKPSSAICLAASLDAADDDIHYEPTPPPRKSCSTISPSPLHLTVRSSSEHHVPLRELLLLSPSPPVRRHRPRLHVHADAENIDPDVTTPRKRSKNHRSSAAAANSGFGMWCSSPRNVRRSRRRLEREILTREVREAVKLCDEDPGKPRRVRGPSRAAVSGRNENLLSSPAVQLLSLPDPSERGHNTNEDSQLRLNGVCKLISDLVMWKDAAKSSLWFGFGTLCFASSCFSKNIKLSLVSVISHAGLLVLALSFFCDTFSHRFEENRRRQISLKEEDMLRLIRMTLPVANAAMAVVQDVFSGEPSMTLKVAPVLFVATKYGHLITLWRFLAVGFFLSFSVPKIVASYSDTIIDIADNANCRISEAWSAWRHKRAAVLAAGLMFWGLLSVKTRVFAVFVAVVMLRYRRQQSGGDEAVHNEAGTKEESTEGRGDDERKAKPLAGEMEKHMNFAPSAPSVQ